MPDADTHTVDPSTTDGFDTITLSSPADLEAVFAPSVGMIGCSLRHRGDELLGQRRGLAAYADDGSTMGIPLLAPWANRLARPGYSVLNKEVAFDIDDPLLHLDPNGLPIHGILAASPFWETTREEADDDGAQLSAVLDFGAHDDYLEIFPFPHRLEMDVALREDALEIATTLTATGDIEVPVAFGFHPYFQLPGVPRAEWQVHLAVRRRVPLDNRSLPTGDVELVDYPDGPLGNRTFDDLYDELSDSRSFKLWGGSRDIQIHFGQHFRCAQVYAPPDDDVIAIEPMTAPVNPFDGGRRLDVVPPDESVTATFNITVRDSTG